MIGNVLKYMRKNNNMKQQQISEAIGVARNTVSQYETETIQPTFETIEKIANVCGYKIYFEKLIVQKNLKVRILNVKMFKSVRF